MWSCLPSVPSGTRPVPQRVALQPLVFLSGLSRDLGGREGAVGAFGCLRVVLGGAEALRSQD